MKTIKVRNKIVILCSFENCVNNKKLKAVFEALKVISNLWKIKFDVTFIDFHEHRVGPQMCLDYYMGQHKDYYNPDDLLKFEILDSNIECSQDVILLYNHIVRSGDYDLIIDLYDQRLWDLSLLRYLFLVDNSKDFVIYDQDEVTQEFMTKFLITLSGNTK